MQWNYGLLGDGYYTVEVVADGWGIATAGFYVQTPGLTPNVAFLRGAVGRYDLAAFPWFGNRVTVEWQESMQNFGVIGRQSGGMSRRLLI